MVGGIASCNHEFKTGGIEQICMSRAYPQYCWEFHEQLRLVNEKATSEKEKVPATHTESHKDSGNALDIKSPVFPGLGDFQLHRRQEFQNSL